MIKGKHLYCERRLGYAGQTAIKKLSASGVSQSSRRVVWSVRRQEATRTENLSSSRGRSKIAAPADIDAKICPQRKVIPTSIIQYSEKKQHVSSVSISRRKATAARGGWPKAQSDCAGDST